MRLPFLFPATLANFLIFLACPLPSLSASPPPEPTEAFLIAEDVNIITGLYIRKYSLGNDGVVDYQTARQIIISEYNEFWNSVVQTHSNPLFYWYDPDHDGQYSMWVDQVGNGCLCDVVPYSDPGKIAR